MKNRGMSPEFLLSLGRISEPRQSPDGMWILYGVTKCDIKRNSSSRNLYVCRADGSLTRQLTRFSGSVNCARWAPDGKSIYYIYKGQLRQERFRDGKLSGRRTLSAVRGGMEAFKISPDTRKIIFICRRPNPLVKKEAGAYITSDLMYRHWDRWRTDIPRSFISRLNEGKITLASSVDILEGEDGIELPAEPFSGIEQLSWAPDSRRIAYSCRKLRGREYAFSTNSEIFIYDSEARKTSRITCGGGYDTSPVWSPDGGKLAWLSMERDGYESDLQRIMIAEVNGLTASSARRICEDFDHDAESLLWCGDGLYFNALCPPGVKALFRVGPDGKAERLTSEELWFDFGAPAAVSQGRVLCACCSMERPHAICYASKSGVEIIADCNEKAMAKLDGISQKSVSIKTTDGRDMQAWVLYPPRFSEKKRYPAIEIVLGGPQGTNSQCWSYRWCYRFFAQNGFVVILPNRRGTTAFGQEWKEQISGDYCGQNMQDYLSAAKWLKSLPYIGKLGCAGASYGGYSAYMLEGIHDGIFDCFVAHAGIFDEKIMWYTTEEMWFPNWDNGGLMEYSFEEGKTGPQGDGIHFGGIQQAGAPYSSVEKAKRHYANSPDSMITNWKTPILCTHGMLDYRVDYEQGMAAFNAARMMGVDTKLIIFEDETHWITKAQNAILWYREVLKWLKFWL
ncbi:MAG: S9 family peptidase [Bacteroidales bacterium]|nr:S9 family peptidase [Bacteroidales bacterium]